ncbi:hypothetical protein V6R21_00160 [Limibacter armeniacum]
MGCTHDGQEILETVCWRCPITLGFVQSKGGRGVMVKGSGEAQLFEFV